MSSSASRSGFVWQQVLRLVFAAAALQHAASANLVVLRETGLSYEYPIPMPPNGVVCGPLKLRINPSRKVNHLKPDVW